MAKADTPAAPPAAEKKKRAPAVKLEPTVRKCASLLKEVGQLYKEAADSMAKNDIADAMANVGLAADYMALFASLAQKMADDETVTNLVETQEK